MMWARVTPSGINSASVGSPLATGVSMRMIEPPECGIVSNHDPVREASAYHCSHKGIQEFGGVTFRACYNPAEVCFFQRFQVVAGDSGGGNCLGAFSHP